HGCHAAGDRRRRQPLHEGRPGGRQEAMIVADAIIPKAPPLTASALFGITITLAAYALALAVHARLRWLHPLLVTCVLVIALLLAWQLPLAVSRGGGDFFAFSRAPAPAAPAVPFYNPRLPLARHAGQIGVTILVGCIIGILSAAACALAFHAAREITL